MNIEYFREFTVLADCSNYLEAAGWWGRLLSPRLFFSLDRFSVPLDGH